MSCCAHGSVGVVIYRPGSQAVTPAFFDDLSETLDRVASYCDPVYIVGHLNVRLDRSDDASNVLGSSEYYWKSTGSLFVTSNPRTLRTARLKAVVNVIAPFLTALFNKSLSSGSVPEAFKAAYITVANQPLSRLK